MAGERDLRESQSESDEQYCGAASAPSRGHSPGKKDLQSFLCVVELFIALCECILLIVTEGETPTRITRPSHHGSADSYMSEDKPDMECVGHLEAWPLWCKTRREAYWGCQWCHWLWGCG